MKAINDILSKEEIKRYEEGWKNFRGKYRLNSVRNTHSGMPVISEIYRFKDSIFRAHVFNKKLRKFDLRLVKETIETGRVNKKNSRTKNKTEIYCYFN